MSVWMESKGLDPVLANQYGHRTLPIATINLWMKACLQVRQVLCGSAGINCVAFIVQKIQLEIKGSTHRILVNSRHFKQNGIIMSGFYDLLESGDRNRDRIMSGFHDFFWRAIRIASTGFSGLNSVSLIQLIYCRLCTGVLLR